MIRCFISGGSGFIGRCLLSQLDSLEIEYSTSTRDGLTAESSGAFVRFNHGFDIVHDALLSGVDTVYHLANVAHTNLSLSESYLYHEVNVKGTQDLLDAAIRSGVRSFVYISSVKAAGDPDDLYGETKQQAENIVLRYGKEYGLHVVVLRPALVYGPGVKGNLHSLISGIMHQNFPWKYVRLSEFNNVRSMVSVHDVVSAMLLSASNKIANGKIYTLSDGEPYTPCQLQNAIYDAAGLKPPSLQIPRWMVSAAAYVGQVVQNTTGKTMPFNYSVYDKLTASAQYDASRTREELGWLPQHTFYSQLPAMLDGLYRQPD